ncbi:MAG TPA: septum formation initiator family protein [Candidatus Angelobacter sp.]|jgi:cell division protein FtsB|nr:septum formation initiator family protein [Candidatus Angelobacter sp.]
MDTQIQNAQEQVHGWRRRLATPVIALLLGLGAYYVVFSANGLLVYQQKRHESRDLDQQIKTLQQQNEAMQQEIKALKTDPQTIEKEAREHLRYTRPGEVVFTVPTAPATPTKEKK